MSFFLLIPLTSSKALNVYIIHTIFFSLDLKPRLGLAENQVMIALCYLLGLFSGFIPVVWVIDRAQNRET